MKYDSLREGLVELLNSFNYTYSLYDGDGKKTSNPYLCRYIYVTKPNMMFIIDEEQNKIEFHKSNFNFKTFKKILGVIRRLTMEYFINLEVSNYNKEFKAKDFSKDIMRRRYNLDKSIETLGESKSKKSTQVYEKYDTVTFLEQESHYLMTDSTSRKFIVDKALHGVFPHLAEQAIKGKLTNQYINAINDLNNKYKVLDEKTIRVTMNTVENKLYQKAAKLLKRITF